jgi:hypothetical protein
MKTVPHTSTGLVSLLALAMTVTLHAAPVAAGVSVGLGGGLGTSVGGGGAFGGAGIHAGGVTGVSGVGAHVGGAGMTGVQAAGSNASATGQAKSGFSTDADIAVDKTEFETIGMRQARLTADTAEKTTTHGAATASVDTRSALAKAEATTSDEIRATTHNDRAKVTADVTAGMTGLNRALAEVKAHSASMTAEQRVAFNAAMKDTDAKAKVVKKDVKVASKASADDWADARAKLSEDYAAYVHAAEHAQVIAESADSVRAPGASGTAASRASATANANASATATTVSQLGTKG